MINSIVFSKLFYRSAVWSGTYKQNIHKLQLMQNFAARILTDTRKYDHITPVLKALGWLTIEEQLRFRDVTIMYKCVNNLVPAYINCKIGKRSNAHTYNLRNSEDLNQNAGQRLPSAVSFIGQQKRGIVSITTLELLNH